MCIIKLEKCDDDICLISSKGLDTSIGFFTDYIKELDRLNLRLPLICESVNFLEFWTLIYIDELKDYTINTFWKEKVLSSYLELFKKITSTDLNKDFIELNNAILKYIDEDYFFLSFGDLEYYGMYAETLENLLIRKYLDTDSIIHFVRTDDGNDEDELYSYDVIVNKI